MGLDRRLKGHYFVPVPSVSSGRPTGEGSPDTGHGCGRDYPVQGTPRNLRRVPTRCHVLDVLDIWGAVPLGSGGHVSRGGFLGVGGAPPPVLVRPETTEVCLPKSGCEFS